MVRSSGTASAGKVDEEEFQNSVIKPLVKVRWHAVRSTPPPFTFLSFSCTLISSTVL
jgi:hypothetical protein